MAKRLESDGRFHNGEAKMKFCGRLKVDDERAARLELENGDVLGIDAPDLLNVLFGEVPCRAFQAGDVYDEEAIVEGTPTASGTLQASEILIRRPWVEHRLFVPKE